MLHALAMLGVGFMLYEFVSWIRRGFRPKLNKNITYTNFGETITINGVVFTNNGHNGYTDPTNTYLYGKTLNHIDGYWILPGLAITQQQFFEGIAGGNNTSITGQNTIKIRRKRNG